MSREIKFRMWNDQGKRFHFGSDAFECLRQQMCGVYDHVGRNGAAFEQFTGLTDKNGVEIYEGDVLSHCPEKFPKDKPLPYEIIFKDGSFRQSWKCVKSVKPILCADTLKEFQDTIIGNIHEGEQKPLLKVRS